MREPGPGEVAGFVNGTGFASGFFGSTIYIFLIGLLMAQYTLTGYDASAHMTEETHDADISGPKGVYKSVVISIPQRLVAGTSVVTELVTHRCFRDPLIDIAIAGATVGRNPECDACSLARFPQPAVIDQLLVVDREEPGHFGLSRPRRHRPHRQRVRHEGST